MPEASNGYRKQVMVMVRPRGRTYFSSLFSINKQTLWGYEIQSV